jgi:hypothetical protein
MSRGDGATTEYAVYSKLVVEDVSMICRSKTRTDRQFIRLWGWSLRYRRVAQWKWDIFILW